MKNDPPSLSLNLPNLTQRQYSTLIEIIRIFNSSLDLKVVIHQVMENARVIMEAEASSLLLLDNTTGDLIWISATGEVGEKVLETTRLPKGSGIAGWVVENRVPLLINDVYSHPHFDPTMDQKTGYKTRTMICSPLIFRDNLIGIAQVINSTGNPNAEFTTEQARFFNILCEHAAIAIQNALLHQETVRLERNSRDLELAQVIQKSFMPDPRSAIEGYRIWCLNRPAFIVGGDFYDFFQVDSNRYFFCVGDVSGKSIPAALYMARFLSDLRYVASSIQQPGKIFEALNQLTLQRGMTNMYVTLLGGIIEQSSGLVHLCCAGHPSPILLNQNCEPRVLPVIGRPPIGLLNDLQYPHQTLALSPGDRLLLYTDGITDAMNPQQESIGINGLLDMVSTWNDNGDELLHQIFDRVKQHLSNPEKSDDLSALMIDRLH